MNALRPEVIEPELARAALLVEYGGRADRELDAALLDAVGLEPDWAGTGVERFALLTERAWHFPTRAEANAALARVSSGVSRAGVRARVRDRATDLR